MRELHICHNVNNVSVT